MSMDRESGWAAFQSGNVEQALEMLQAACEQDPNDVQAHLYLGAVLGKTGRHQEAVARYFEAAYPGVLV